MLHVCCTRSTTLSVSSANKVNPAGIYFDTWNTNIYTDEIGASAFIPCKSVHALRKRKLWDDITQCRCFACEDTRDTCPNIDSFPNIFVPPSSSRLQFLLLAWRAVSWAIHGRKTLTFSDLARHLVFTSV